MSTGPGCRVLLSVHRRRPKTADASSSTSAEHGNPPRRSINTDTPTLALALCVLQLPVISAARLGTAAGCGSLSEGTLRPDSTMVAGTSSPASAVP